MICSGDPIFSIFLYDVLEQTFSQLQVVVQNMILTDFNNIEMVDLGDLRYMILVNDLRYLLDLSSQEYSLEQIDFQ